MDMTAKSELRPDTIIRPIGYRGSQRWRVVGYSKVGGHEAVVVECRTESGGAYVSTIAVADPYDSGFIGTIADWEVVDD